ncbi:STP1 protein, partial [Plasmodium ovale]
MADDSEITTLTRYIPVDVFLGMIEGNIKKLIHTYGHTNCGLRQEELCEKIKKIISEHKNIIFEHMDTRSKKKWSKEWDSQRSKYFSRLYQEEGFINMCFPNKYPKKNQSLNQLLSKHIEFCKEKDQRLSVIGKNREYSVCLEYNKWIIAEKTSFTSEYLQNVKIYKINNVKKYFSTKEHPEGYNPLTTYHGIKLNCEIYNPESSSYQPIPVENTLPNSIHPPTAHDVRHESQKIGGKSMPDEDGEVKKNKPNVQILHQTEASSSDSQTSSLTNTNVDGTPNGKLTDLKAKVTDSQVNAQGPTGKSAEATDTIAPSFQQIPEPPSSISLKDSLVAKVPDTLPSVNKDQGTVSDVTPSTTSATSGTIHSTKDVRSPLAPDLSLDQSQTQPPAIAPVTDKYSQESTPPDLVSKSTHHGSSLNSASDPVLAPSQTEASNSNASETSSKATISTPGPSLSQDSHLSTPSTPSTQPVVTTSIDTTLILTTASVSGPPTIAVSVMSTNTVPSITGIKSTTGGIGETNEPLTTISDSQDTNFAYPKIQDSVLPPNTGAQFPDTPFSAASANLNVIVLHDLLPALSSGSPPLYLPISYPGLSSGVSPVGLPPVLPVIPAIVAKPGGNKIRASPKDTTKVSSTSLPKGTQPSDKSIITPTKSPPLSSIIPTIYTPFGFLLGRRRKRKKRDLRSTFVIPEESTYESPNIALHEWEDHNLLEQTVKNEEYVKLLKINRYKQEMQKRKKENKKTLIEVHMEVLEEYKSDEWELHKGDFLEICLRGFINEENDTYLKLPN